MSATNVITAQLLYFFLIFAPSTRQVSIGLLRIYGVAKFLYCGESVNVCISIAQ